jgi:hypothetical protein
MILFSQPRSGTEWFLRGLTDYRYVGWELFNQVHQIPGTGEYDLYGKISFETKISMLRSGANNNKSFKIHYYDLKREMQKNTWPVLNEAIQLHDHYKITRNNIKEVMVSNLLAIYNNHNFHNRILSSNQVIHDHNLSETGVIDKFHVVELFDQVYNNTKEMSPIFDYKETFVYEDLLNGINLPKTLKWDPSKSLMTKRGSMQMVNLITNKDQVLKWIDELIALVD